VFGAIAARRPRFQEALILEEVQMSPALDAGVTGRAKFAALRKAKALALLKIPASIAVGAVRLQIGIPLLSSPLRVAKAAVNNAFGVIAHMLFP
jgi:hypothetical protein